MQHVFFRRRNAKYLILPRKCEIMISNNQNQNNSLTNLGQITLRGKSPTCLLQLNIKPGKGTPSRLIIMPYMDTVL